MSSYLNPKESLTMPTGYVNPVKKKTVLRKEKKKDPNPLINRVSMVQNKKPKTPVSPGTITDRLDWIEEELKHLDKHNDRVATILSNIQKTLDNVTNGLTTLKKDMTEVKERTSGVHLDKVESGKDPVWMIRLECEPDTGINFHTKRFPPDVDISVLNNEVGEDVIALSYVRAPTVEDAIKKIFRMAELQWDQSGQDDDEDFRFITP